MIGHAAIHVMAIDADAHRTFSIGFSVNLAYTDVVMSKLLG
jgi:hypothetical protein